MSSILPAPFDGIDEMIHRQYTKLTVAAEKKGINKYKTATFFNCLGRASLIASTYFCFASGDINKSIGSIFACGENSREAYSFNRRAENAEDNEAYNNSKDLEIERIKCFHNMIRLPILVAGVYNLATGIMSLFNYMNGDANALNKTVGDASLGVGLVSWSSAMYVRDADPKILDKKPFYKKIADWLSERLSPEPVPMPLKEYSLESCVKSR